MFFKKETAYEMRISDWSSGVCSSDLAFRQQEIGRHGGTVAILLRHLFETEPSDVEMVLRSLQLSLMRADHRARKMGIGRDVAFQRRDAVQHAVGNADAFPLEQVHTASIGNLSLDRMSVGYGEAGVRKC